ncbi:MAG: DUF488 domain-containing protein [Novosphingobium sp.]|uniref:DUF488 domain-containing protein n=1 Tax=Sphingomonadales TaxID=204457 RepID=UPI00076FF709|nr:MULTISPECIES: DUF488 domain-containing protein [Sphingomonadaceae]AMK21546.1 hypothetical protein K426_02945 [Sphingobium sp. TKS]MCP5386886.1 DUF488 domain-containing protein [Novosphingobium sp.]
MGTLSLKRAYVPPDPNDGIRLLIDRLWPRGVSRSEAAIDCWMKEIAPSVPLRKWFGHDPARFAEFSERYREELDENPEAVAQLCDMVRQHDVTLVYAARDPHINHARVLAEYLAEHECSPNATT